MTFSHVFVHKEFFGVCTFSTKRLCIYLAILLFYRHQRYFSNSLKLRKMKYIVVIKTTKQQQNMTVNTDFVSPHVFKPCKHS